MRRTILLFALLLFAGFTGNVLAQSVIRNDELPDFAVIALSGNMNVELIEADKNAIEVQLYESDIKKFTWSVNGDGVLSVTLRPTVGQKARADIRLYYKAEIKEVTVNGARLTVEDEIVSSLFRLAVSGGGSASVAVAADDVEVEVTSNSAVVVTGETTYLSIRATERSKVDTRKLNAVSAETEAVTGGEIYVFASERIVANARHASSIHYTGKPTIVKNRTSRSSMGSGVYNIDK